MATYYIAPTGDDATGLGTLASPWFTINKAWTAIVNPGDIIYCRGGQYDYTTQQIIENVNGILGNPIKIYNYPGEKPVFDYSTAVVNTTFIGFKIEEGDYIHVKGLRITNIAQNPAGTTLSYGLWIGDDIPREVNNVLIENVECDHIGGPGFSVQGNTINRNLHWLNCDSHHNGDPYSVAPVGINWGAADGFVVGNRNTDAENYIFQNCRAWWNSDDGWDCRNGNPYMTFINCWSFWNGYQPGTWLVGGNGIGFKTGGKYGGATTDYLREMHNCIAFQNRVNGFDPQPDDVDLWFSSIYYNCVAWANGDRGFASYWYQSADYLRNCIAYENGGVAYAGNAFTNSSNNSWDVGIDVTVTDDDFVSLDPTGVDGARDSNGVLPVLTFLHLAEGSDLIKAGTNVGLLYDADYGLWSNPPSMGAFEWFVAPFSFSNITLVNTPACYNAVDNTIISRWVATECPINFTLLRRDYYVLACAEDSGYLALKTSEAFLGNDGDVISVYDQTTNSMYTGTITNAAGGAFTNTLGNTDVYALTSTTASRRAQNVIFTEDATIQSITIYHNGGTGDFILGVYANTITGPGALLGVTASTAVNAGAGWQEVDLITPVAVTAGESIWLAWVFETNPGLRYVADLPPRAESADLWAGGMPDPFGVATFANYKYSLYCTYTYGPPSIITDIPYVYGMDIKYLNDHTLYAGYYFEGRLTINGIVENLTVIASPDSFGYADLDVSGILRIKTSIGKVTNYLSLIQKDTNKSGQFTLEYRGCWYGSNEAYISEGSQTSPAEDVIWYYAECVRSEEQGCNLAEYVPTDLNDAPFLNQFDTPVYWYGLPFDLSFILPERAELSPTSDIIVTMKVYNSANVQMGADIVQTIDVDSLEGYVNSLNIDSTLIDAGAAYFTVEIFSM